MFHESRCSRGSTFLDVDEDVVVVEAIAEGGREGQKEESNSNHVDVAKNPTRSTRRFHFQNSEICKSRSS